MASLQERLAAAAAPDFQVMELVGRGGMGAVYRAYDINLERWVAIKVLLPEFATEAAERRFLREARTLASLKHSRIVLIHVVKKHQGLSFFVMEFVEGATLSELLKQGRFTIDQIVALGDDLLDAVGSVHRRGVVHCDIKPANIFMSDGRAVLGDFGIASVPRASDATKTERGIAGTPMYMAPEQSAGQEPTPRTDLYGVSLVLYEAFSGRPWPVGLDPQSGDWKDFPGSLRRIVKKGLNIDPDRRWSSASEFRSSLVEIGKSPWKKVAVVVALAVGISAAGVVMVRSEQPIERVIQIQTQPGTGGTSIDSVAGFAADLLYRGLAGGSDFRVCHPIDACAGASLTIRVQAAQSIEGLVLRARSSERLPAVSISREVHRDSIVSAVHSMTAETFLRLWQSRSPIYDDLPNEALPESPAAMQEFIVAEQLWHAGRFPEAKAAYIRSFEIDAACFLCSWRITEMQRWLQEHPDTLHFSRTLRNLHVFPEHYKLLITARTQPVDERLRLLREAITQGNSFFLTHFAYGDELFHRGALVGTLREEAADELFRAAQRRPLFVPAWEHALWAFTALGDTTRAAGVRARLDSLPPMDAEAEISRVLHTTAFDFRFRGGPDPQAFADRLPTLFEDPRTDAGPRWMIGFGAPMAAVQMGQLWAQGGYESGYNGMLAQFFGHIGLGQLSRAQTIAMRVRQSFPDRTAFPAFVAQLRVAIRLVDPMRPGQLSDVTADLDQLDLASLASPQERESVVWMRAIVHGRENIAEDHLIQDDRLMIMLNAIEAANSGDVQRAIRMTDELIDGELGKDLPVHGPRDDDRYPFYRAMLYSFRAQWLEEVEQDHNAVRHLRWHEYTDMPDIPMSDPKSYEVDWALGGVASWHRARLLDRGVPSRELCRLYGEVSRLWKEGDEVYAARAAAALDRWAALGCEARQSG